LPHYLKAENRSRIAANSSRIDFQTISFQEALKKYPDGYFTRLHLSNLGDWSDENQFADLLKLIRTSCYSGTRICYRYLQKNHFLSQGKDDFAIDIENSGMAERKDRFPFYGILQLTLVRKE
jgi:S-adenosylmethionine:diacylglycerol 3-amino-3-carboxypropyl transferase